MNVYFVIIVVAILSFIWAIWSLRSLTSHKKEVDKASEDLKKGKIVFSNEHHSSSSSS